MEPSGYVDIFATKGMEYIFILGFIVILVFFWKFLNRAGRKARPDAGNGEAVQQRFKECRLPQNLHYHQGHSWVKPEGPDVARIGVDDFAQRLIGRADFIELPRVGAFLEQGENGWRLESDSVTVDILSPVDGEVLEINEKVRDDPQIINRDPFGIGWLLKVRMPKMKGNLTNLLSGKLAAAWMQESIEAVCGKISEKDVSAKQVNPIPGNETAEESSRHRWNALVRESLLCK